MKRYLSSLIMIMVLIACDGDEKDQENKRLCCGGPQQELSGNWKYVERGYSPGAGYIIQPADPDPIRTVRFGGGTVSSDLQELESFNYYRLETDQQSRLLLNLYKVDPTSPISTIEESYFVELEDDKLKLLSMKCIEGCHIGFSRIDE